MIADGLTKFSSKQIWTKLRTIRASYLSSNLSSRVKNKCDVFVPDAHLNMNVGKMSEYLRLSNTSAETLNLKKEIIDESAKMFIYLHSCPDSFQYWADFAPYFIVNIPKIILITSKIITKSFSLDGRNILSKFLSKYATKLGFQFLLVKENSLSKQLGYSLIKDLLQVKGEVAKYVY